MHQGLFQVLEGTARNSQSPFSQWVTFLVDRQTNIEENIRKHQWRKLKKDTTGWYFEGGTTGESFWPKLSFGTPRGNRGQKDPWEQKPWGETFLGIPEGKREGWSMPMAEEQREWKCQGGQSADQEVGSCRPSQHATSIVSAIECLRSGKGEDQRGSCCRSAGEAWSRMLVEKLGWSAGIVNIFKGKGNRIRWWIEREVHIHVIMIRGE